MHSHSALLGERERDVCGSYIVSLCMYFSLPRLLSRLLTRQERESMIMRGMDLRSLDTRSRTYRGASSFSCESARKSEVEEQCFSLDDEMLMSDLMQFSRIALALQRLHRLPLSVCLSACVCVLPLSLSLISAKERVVDMFSFAPASPSSFASFFSRKKERERKKKKKSRRLLVIQ